MLQVTFRLVCMHGLQHVVSSSVQVLLCYAPAIGARFLPAQLLTVFNLGVDVCKRISHK